MDVSEILKFLEKYGIRGSIVAVIVVVLYFLVKTKWFTKFFTFIFDWLIEHLMKKKSNGKSDITESDIINHDIFNYIDFWMYSKVPAFQFSTEYRTAVFRRYLSIYLKSHKEVLLKYINSKHYEEMNDSELWSSLLSLINDIIYSYEKEMEIAGIPRVVISKMKNKNNDTITLTIDLIEGICNSQFYQSEKNWLKIYSILNIILSILENTIANSESVCNSINGQLKGLTFDGKTEP